DVGQPRVAPHRLGGHAERLDRVAPDGGLSGLHSSNLQRAGAPQPLCSAREALRSTRMKPPRTLALLVGLLIALVAILPGCQKYDTLVEKDQTCDQKWAVIEAQLQRRYDLVPNLVATVKGSAKHEEDTLAQVTQARAAATQIKLTSDDLTDPAK